eukprot:COSAG05_NODE_761_length_7487_cov_150.318760_1_plen_71_part_10
MYATGEESGDGGGSMYDTGGTSGGSMYDTTPAADSADTDGGGGGGFDFVGGGSAPVPDVGGSMYDTPAADS